ncbi:hypothetical protein UA08_04741 [Talaromyces atroroseus]|uniref:Major facilitator superfamily (MFS) profile domain-containing protein n=1 Tax=Talaromyces atroroseus TaxID=1441469 RepID=A0A225AES0_TALAT|nr:hypothetical protein UA08_04741 [Talaromyces atroroseus]OKL59781.1 hypothetical protein UA08_04741 [Talaromyces atroroseus]
MIALPGEEVSQERNNKTIRQQSHGEKTMQIISPDETNTEGNDNNGDQQQNNPDTTQDLRESTTATSEKPYTSFSLPQKWFVVGMATAASFFSPLSGQIYYPVLPILAENYHLSQTLLNISVTTYMIFQGLTPSFMGTFSDASGRRPGYILAFIIYTAANIGLAEQNSYAALLVLRCLQSAGSSGTVSFGYGVIADVTTTAERGTYMGPMAAGVMMGPALGPVIGGLLSQFLGWRSVFWFLVIISGSYLVIFTLFQPESHRGIVGDGSILPSESWRLSVLQYIRIRRKQARMSVEEKQEYDEARKELRIQQKNRKLAFPNPLLSFVILLEPDALMLILYIALMFFGATIMMTSLPSLFPGIYGLNELEVGLCFLPLGVSSALGAVANGKLLDWNYRRLAVKHGMSIDSKHGDDLTNFPIEKARIQMPLFWASLLAATFLGYGWALDYKTSLAVPLVISFILGFSLICTMNSLNTLLTDIFPSRVSTASAASNLVRCLLGAVGAAVVDSMIDAMGIGWCFTFTGLVMGAAVMFLWCEYKWGMQWRQKRWRKKAEKVEAV